MRPRSGNLLGHYRLLERIGQGGMGVVWRAHDTRLGREVAIKILRNIHPEHHDCMNRLKREAIAIASLNHRNIVTVFSFEEAESSYFITMELIQGKRLSEVIAGQSMALTDFLRLAISLTDAIRAAHEHGVIHRDLKPDNIMVTDRGELKVLDFGLARLGEGYFGAALESLSTQTLSVGGEIMGTIPYMSPEQLQGLPADARSDIFSLGVIYYEMCTGERPFLERTIPELISAMRRGIGDKLLQINPGIPERLNQQICQCLEPEAEERPQSVMSIGLELEKLRKENVPECDPMISTIDPIGTQRHAGRVPGPKYYIYTSARKLEMFLGQMSETDIMGIAKELRLRNMTENLAGKTRIVSEYILKHLEVGNVEKPASFFMDTMEMKSGILTGVDRYRYLYFTGIVRDRHIGLIGSADNVQEEELSGRSSSSELTHYLLPRILSAFGTITNDGIVFHKEAADLSREIGANRLQNVLRELYLSTAGPSQRFEFLAKRLFSSAAAIVGTPVYVALAE